MRDKNEGEMKASTPRGRAGKAPVTTANAVVQKAAGGKSAMV